MNRSFRPTAPTRFGNNGVDQKRMEQRTNNKTSKPNPITTYKSIYNNAFQNRMRYYYRLSAIVAFVVSLLLTIPFQTQWIFFPVKFLCLWFGYLILQQARTVTISIDSSTAGNYIQKLISIFSSWKSYILFGSFLANSMFVSWIIYLQSDSTLNYYIETPTKTIKPFINDNFAFFCFFTVVAPIFYCFNFLINEKYVLDIPIGTFRQEPVDYLKKLPHLKILLVSILRSLFSFLILPLIYHIFFRNLFFHIVLKPLVIFFSLNSQLPRADVNFNLLFKIVFYSWVTFLSLDILNELFNAYASVGCLVVNKPISHHSTTPVQTLLSGMKDYDNPLVRLTAYQELTYLSTSKDFKDRSIFYRGDNWTFILSEYYFVLINAAKAARSDLKITKKSDSLHQIKVQNLKKQTSLFGNLNSYKNDLDFDFDFEIKDLTNSNGRSQGDKDHDTTIVKGDNEDIFTKPQLNEKISILESKYDSLVTLGYDLVNRILEKIEFLLSKYFESDTNKNNSNKENDSIKLQLNVLFNDLSKLTRHLIFGTIEEQSNKRIPNKSIVGFSIISLTEILINSKIEDKNKIVTSTLTECLTLLTKVYKGTSEFLNNPPSEIDSNNECSIKIINDLAIGSFFKLVIYYNNSLNDLLLAPEVFKLAQWCTDMALEQQREQNLRTNILQ